MSATWMRLNTCPGLTMRCARALGELDERVPPRPVDAGEAEDAERHVRAAPPSSAHAFSAAIRAAVARHARVGRRLLVDPGAAVVAIDADGGEVADPAELRRGEDVVAMHGEHRVAGLALRDRDEDVGGLLKRRGDAVARPLPVEDEVRRCPRRRSRAALSALRTVPPIHAGLAPHRVAQRRARCSRGRR